MTKNTTKAVPRILIVDDVEANRFVLRDIIADMGYQPVLTENGAQALKMIQHIRPQLIILDIAMPEMDGYEATQVIRRLSHPQAKTIPIYAMTANAFTESVNDAFHAGMNGHIEKPIDTARVYELLRMLVEKES